LSIIRLTERTLGIANFLRRPISGAAEGAGR